MIEKYITVNVAAEKWGVSPRTVRSCVMKEELMVLLNLAEIGRYLLTRSDQMIKGLYLESIKVGEKNIIA